MRDILRAKVPLCGHGCDLMRQGTLQLSEVQLRLLVQGFVRLRLKTNEYRIVSTENFGNHWRVLVKCRDDLTEAWSYKHLFAISHYGRLVWDRPC